SRPLHPFPTRRSSDLLALPMTSPEPRSTCCAVVLACTLAIPFRTSRCLWNSSQIRLSSRPSSASPPELILCLALADPHRRNGSPCHSGSLASARRRVCPVLPLS